MKKLTVTLLAAALVVSLGACKGNSSNEKATDTAQEHVGNSGPADTGLQTNPVETGGKDTSGNGQGTTNMSKDTVKTNP